MADSPHFRIGTRGSDLAMWQAHHVRDLILAYGGTCDITVLSTQGDREQVQAFEARGRGLLHEGNRTGPPKTASTLLSTATRTSKPDNQTASASPPSPSELQPRTS